MNSETTIVIVPGYDTTDVRIGEERTDLIGDAGVGPMGPSSPGTPGPSAYDVAVLAGFEGTEEEWLESLVGPAGQDGTDGTDGTNGTDGQDGQDGTDATAIYGDPVAVNKGGTGANTAAGARTNLDAQQHDADLDTIAALDPSTAGALVTDGAGWIRKTYAQLKTALGLSKADVGLGNVDNTADSAKAFAGEQITSGTVADARIAATIARDAEVTAAVAAEVTARNAAIAQAIADLISAAPGLLDTLDEIAAALGDDPNFAATMTTALATKVAKSLFDANTILAANADDTPGPVTVGEQTLVGRITGGNIVALTPSQIRTLLTLVIGTNVQAWDADLDTLAANITAFGQSLAAAANAAAAKTLLSLVKGDVGLGNVDNTSDANKPVSTAQQTALDGKQPLDADLTALAQGGGWLADTNTWTRTGNLTFTVPVDASVYLKPGTLISYNDGAVDYGVVASSVFSAGTTTVTLITNSDYAMAATTITAPRYSYAARPQGFPTAFNWVPTEVGWATLAPSNKVYRWSPVGSRRLALDIHQGTAGTSSAAGHSLTLPVTAATITDQVVAVPCLATDNNVQQTGLLSIASAGTIVSCSGILSTNTNTATGSSRINSGQIVYEY